MARKTTPTSGRRQTGVTRGAKPAATRGRAAGATAPAKKAPARRTATAPKPKAAASRTPRAPAAPRAPTQSKQELRDRIEKLERANVVLRAKNREAVEASREAANRIDQLQEQLSRHSGAQPAPAAADAPPAEAAADEAPPKTAARRGRKPKPVPDEPAADIPDDEES